MQNTIFFVNHNNKYFGAFSDENTALNSIIEWEKNYFNNVDDEEKSDLMFCYKENTKSGTWEEIINYIIKKDMSFYKSEIRVITLNDDIQTMEEMQTLNEYNKYFE